MTLTVRKVADFVAMPGVKTGMIAIELSCGHMALDRRENTRFYLFGRVVGCSFCVWKDV